ALNFHGRLKFLHGQNRVSEDGSLPSILEIRSRTLLFQTKHKMDFTPIGIDSR
ncbi:unnamed protein product, partial [Menidia menidia]